MDYENEKVKASPAIRRIAKQYGINLNEVIGTGEGGRIEVENLESYLLSKRHMSFAEMAQSAFENDDEYVNYTDEQEKTDIKPNYDYIDYGIISEDDDIEIELYPVESDDDFDMDSNEEKELEDYLNIENELKKDFATVEEDDMNEKISDYEVYADFKEIVDELTDNYEDDKPLHFNLIDDDDYDEDYDEEEPYCHCCDDDCDCDDDEWDDDEDECDCGCGHDHHHHHEEEEKCQPIKISFTVSRRYLDDLIENLDGEENELIINTVVKALALAIYDEDETFDGKINVVRMLPEERDIEVLTAVNALSDAVDNIIYEEPYDHPDTFVNVWDFTDFGFTSFARPDAGMVNVFVNLNSRKVIIDSISDEYTVCIDTCAYIFKALKENLMDAEETNARSEICTAADNDDIVF